MRCLALAWHRRGVQQLQSVAGTLCIWEVLPADSGSPAVAKGMSTDSATARREVETAMEQSGAALGHLVRTVAPGSDRDLMEPGAWPPLNVIQQCRRDRNGGYVWYPLKPEP